MVHNVHRGEIYTKMCYVYEVYKDVKCENV